MIFELTTKNNDVFIDLGANLGQEIEYFSRLSLNIHSYEPHPYFFNKLYNSQ